MTTTATLGTGRASRSRWWRSPPSRPLGRRRTDALALVVAVAVLALCALPVHADRVSVVERSVFHAVNNGVVVPFVLVWPVMQLGNIAVVPLAALGALAVRRLRLAGSILLGGALVYELAKVVKRMVIRGRPAALLPDVHIHGAAAGGLGFVSGHAAVVALLVMVATPYLARGAWIAAAVLAAAVCLARLYVGAHLPLDVLGGAALGVALGALLRLVLGRPVQC